jgi:DNA-binding beta-propeller fold protein YncE
MSLFPTKRKALAGASCLAVVAALGAGQFWSEKAVAQDAAVEAPRFEVDPFWPKPMPNNWALGQTIGVAVDKDDTIWIVHRGWDPAAFDPTDLAVPPAGSRNEGQVVGECCNPSPPIMQFDQEGNLLQAWGGPSDTGEYEWPTSNHGIAVDDEGFVYIGGNGGSDAHVLKFTSDGEFVAQWGRAHARMVDADGATVAPDPLTGYAGVAPGGAIPEGMSYAANSMDMESFGRVAKIDLDQEANEAYISDGYLNHRVAVLDMDSGEIKRYWGAYGKPPTDEDLGPYDPSAPVAQQFRNPVHCSNVSNDGLVYVCDRPNNRVQIFNKDGTFVQEVFVATDTLFDGSVWDIDFSEDPEQKYLYMADGQNEHIRVFDRASMEELYNFGTGGRQPGMWMGVHSIAVDSEGNIYTTETYTGKRVQKFVNMGLAPVADSVVAWPM